MQHLKRLKTLLQSKLLYIFLFIVSVIYTIYSCQTLTIKENSSETLAGKITDIAFDSDKVSLEIKNNEKFLVTYYFKKDTERDYFLEFNLGDYIKAIGRYEIPKKNTIFHLFNYQEYLLSKNIKYLFKIEVATDFIKTQENTNLFYSLKTNLLNYLDTFKSKDYLKTLIIGENSIDNIYQDSYQKNGISHLFAISGLHITLLTIILKKLLELVTKNEIVIHIILYSFLILFIFLVGFSPSVVRGSLLFIIGSLNKLFKINIKNIYILIFIFSVLLLLNPFIIYSLGFQFSFLISFYLIMCTKIIKRGNNYFSKLFTVSLIAFLASIPICIHAFFEINLLSPFINLIFVPFVSVIIFPLSLITLFITKLDIVLFSLISLMENLSYFISNNIYFNIILKDINWLEFVVYYGIISYVLYSFYKQKYLKIIYLIILLFVHTNINYFDAYPEITMLDVGQGDSTLIKLPNNNGNILIDTGGNIYSNYSIALKKTIPYLKASGIKKIDFLILSHGDYDHASESIPLYENFRVTNVIINSGADNDLEEKIIKNRKYFHFSKNILNVNGYKFYFLNDIDETNENEDSLIIYTKLNNYNILFMGDAGIKSENNLLYTYNLPEMDILKVGHHGSRSSSSLSFIKKINPKISLISTGINNIYNHPSKEVVDILNSVDSSIYNTSQNGSIKLILSEKITTETCFP